MLWMMPMKGGVLFGKCSVEFQDCSSCRGLHAVERIAVSIEKGRTDMLELVSEAVKSMTEGELLQLQKARKLNIREEDYFRIIGAKTAALIAACTACGARSATSNPDTIQLMKDFGESIGIAFQISDDLLDYEGNGLTGKIIRERYQGKENHTASDLFS